ncbi:MAG: hypothetical protein GY847_25615 [Proteobacteria bacterium]|nr:hypothetical protein [Pseudomonadota bacterium]
MNSFALLALTFLLILTSVSCGNNTTEFIVGKTETDDDKSSGDSDTDIDTDSDSDTDTDIDADSSGDTDTNSDTSTDLESDTDADSDVNTDTGTDTSSDTVSDSDINTDKDTATDRDTDTGDLGVGNPCSVPVTTVGGLRVFTGICQDKDATKAEAPDDTKCEGGTVPNQVSGNCRKGLICCIKPGECDRLLNWWAECRVEECGLLSSGFHFGCPEKKWCCVDW